MKDGNVSEFGEDEASSSNNQPVEERLRHLKLYRAAMDGDWKTAEKIYKDNENDITAELSEKKDTALHIAVTANRSTFVNELLQNLPKDKMDLLHKENQAEHTPFCLAAACGNVKLAKLMADKVKESQGVDDSENLAKILGRPDMQPLEMAALFGHKEMVNYLYQITNNKLWKERKRPDLLINMIINGLYDIALDLLDKYEDFATAFDDKLEEALHPLAQMPIVNKQGFLRRCFNLRPFISLKMELDPKAAKLIKCLWKKVVLNDSRISKIMKMPAEQNLIFVAVEQGNIEFLTILIREYPDLLFQLDENGYTIFHCAVKYRQNSIFKLIYRFGSFKDLIAPSKDKKGNNILHLAGFSAPPDRLNIVSGAALQLQRELLWFEAVREIMNPLDVQEKNEQGKTPEVLFSEHHEKLKREGEAWMKGTANSCMIVATLIATVVFAAAFVTPGGTELDTGIPFFLSKDSFTVFAMASAASLVLSCCSILTFLSILTSRYAEKDFNWRLPTMLFIGLLTLFLSVVAMLVVFCATFFIVFNDTKRWCAYLATAIASVPAILYVILQFRLVSDIVSSTYRRSALFKPSNYNFSFKEEKATESKKENLFSPNTKFRQWFLMFLPSICHQKTKSEGLV